MPVPPAYGAAQQAPFTPPPAPQHPAYQQSYTSRRSTQQGGAVISRPHRISPAVYAGRAGADAPTQPDPAENGGYQPPRYTQQYQPPYNEPQPPYQQPYASEPVRAAGLPTALRGAEDLPAEEPHCGPRCSASCSVHSACTTSIRAASASASRSSRSLSFLRLAGRRLGHLGHRRGACRFCRARSSSTGTACRL